MKVALISDYPVREIGGVESYCYHLIKEVEARDSSIVFYPINISNTKHYFLKSLNLYRFSAKQLRHKIEECDIVHINGLASYPSMQAIDISKKLGKKIICTSHFHPSYALNRPFLGDMFYKLIVEKRLKNIDHLIAINKEEYRFLSEKVKECSLIPHWINTEKYVQSPLNEKRERSILFIGKVFKLHKRADFMDYVPDDVKVWYVSAPKYKNEKKNFVQYMNLSDSELQDLYNRTTCLIVPSKYEAFSFVALEALLHGTPVLLSDRVRIADFLDNNKLVSIFEYDNVDSFTEKLNNILSCEITIEERRNSVKKVFETFNPNEIINRYLAIYHEFRTKD